MIYIKKINFKRLIISILISLGVGVVAGLITRESIAAYSAINKPVFAPPSWLFPAVWTLLYILMGISAYLVSGSQCADKQNAIKLYALQLGVNFLWPIIFFSFKLYFVAFVWILLLWVLIIAMILKFYRCNKASAYLQIPYLLWVTFATVLTYAVANIN